MVHLLDQMVVVEKSGLFSKLAQEFGALGAGSAVVDLHLVRQTLSLPGRLNRKRLKNKISSKLNGECSFCFRNEQKLYIQSNNNSSI